MAEMSAAQLPTGCSTTSALTRSARRWLDGRPAQDAEVAARIGAELGERSPTGSRTPRLPAPILGPGSVSWSWPSPAAPGAAASLAFWSPPAGRAGPGRGRGEASVGVSTREVDRLVAQLGLRHLTRTRPGGGAGAWASSSATGAGARAGRVRHQALVIAGGVHPAAAARCSAWTSVRPRPRRSGGRSSRAAGPGAGRRRARHLRCARGLRQAIGQVLGCPGRAARSRSSAACSARSPRGPAAAGSGAICGLGTATTGAEARERLGQVADQPRPPARGAVGGRRDRVAGLRRLPGRALARAGQHRPAGAGQPRDRPPRRCVGSSPTTLPRRGWPGCWCRADRRVADRPARAVSDLHGLVLATDPLVGPTPEQPPAGGPAHRVLSRHPTPTITSHTTKRDLTSRPHTTLNVGSRSLTPWSHTLPGEATPVASGRHRPARATSAMTIRTRPSPAAVRTGARARARLR
jgi:hypothetical protein